MKRIEFDYTNLTSEVVGAERGVGADDLEALAPRVAEAVGRLEALKDRAPVTFLTLPEQDVSALLERAHRDVEGFSDLVVIGIGGSSLGARAVYEALVRPRTGKLYDGSERRGLRLHFIENVDAVAIDDLLESLDLSTTLFNVVTKSGSTIETMSTLFIVRERLLDRFGQAGYRERVIATTDPTEGALRKLAEAEGLASFEVPPAVGGRFSVLSAVGLYPLAAAGIDLGELLAGAARVRDQALRASLSQNTAAMFAATQVALYGKGLGDVVLMPYAESLKGLAAWFVQLWAESLGKVRRDGTAVGPTPIAALGVTDQHSQLQLYMEGPASRNIVFVEVGASGSPTTVPVAPPMCAGLEHLGKKHLDEIRLAELQGVRAGLAEVGRPTSTLRIPHVDADALGGLLMLFEAAVSLAGFLLEVDPYDQPGVELGKKYAHGLLGRASERAYAERLEQGMAARSHRTIGV